MKALSRCLTVSGVVLWVFLACALPLHAQKANNLERAGDRLCDLQADRSATTPTTAWWIPIPTTVDGTGTSPPPQRSIRRLRVHRTLTA